MDPAAKLEQLRERAAVEGNEWLRSEVQGTQRDELQSLAAAAGLRLREGYVRDVFLYSTKMCLHAAVVKNGVYVVPTYCHSVYITTRTSDSIIVMDCFGG